MKRRINDEDIKRFVMSQLNNCYGWDDSMLTEQMAKSMRYYLGGQVLVESDTRSKVRSSDVQEVVDAVMPSLMRIFFAGEKIGVFEAFGPEDEEQARQITEYVHNIITSRHKAFIIFYTWFQDALITKYGVVKRYWEEIDERTVTEKYTGLEQDAVMLLMEDPELEIIEMTPSEISPDEEGQILSDVVCVRKIKHGRVRIENVPPETFFISKSAPTADIQECPFVAQAIYTTVGDLRARGFTFDENKVKSYTAPPSTALEQARMTDLVNEDPRGNKESYGKNEESVDPSIYPVVVFEAYCKLDMNGDGIPELNRIILAGDEILAIDEVQEIPYSVITTRPIPHRIIGNSLADLAAPIHELTTTILRLLIDDYAFNNLGRYLVTTTLTGKETIEDIYDVKAPHVIRVNNPDAVKFLPPAGLPSSAFSLLELFQGIKENRTGITRYNQGLDANSLNKTATGISRIMDASLQKLEIIARVFAETGVKDLYKAVLRLICQNQRKQEVVRLMGKWVTIDPTSWRGDRDFIVDVGIGTGGKEAQIAALTNLYGILTSLKNNPALSDLVPAAGVREVIARLIQVSGFRNPDLFIVPEEIARQIDQQPNPQQMEMQDQMQMQKQRQAIDLERAKTDVAIRKIRALSQTAKTAEQLAGLAPGNIMEEGL